MSFRTITPYLAAVIRSGAPGVVRYRDSSTINAVSFFGTLEVGTSNNNQSVNRVVWFQGTLYATMDTHIYQGIQTGIHPSDPSFIFNAVFTLPSISASTADKSGLHVVTANGVLYLCMLYFDTGGDVRAARSTDGVNWTTDGPFDTGVVSASAFHNELVWRNKLWALTSVGNSSDRMASYSPSTGTLDFYTSPLEPFGMGSIGIFNDNLYFTGASGVSRNLYILDGNFISLDDLGPFNTVTAVYKPGILVDGGYMYVFNTKNTATTGWGCWQVSSSHVITDITSSVIPPGMTGAVGTASRVLVWADTDWAPGSNPPKYIAYSDDGSDGTAVTLYQWQGPGTQMSFFSSGGNVANAFSVAKFPTASGFFVLGPSRVVINSVTGATSGTGLTIAYWVQGPAGTQSVRLWFGLTTDEYLTNIGTLSNPSTGTLNAAATAVTGVVVNNNPSNPYYVTWLPPASILGTNGIGPRYKFGMECFY